MILDLDSKNAHTFCSRNRLEEELELNVAYHYMLESFRALYDKTVTFLWHYGNGADRTATSFHLSCEGLKQGNAPVALYFTCWQPKFTGNIYYYYEVAGYFLQPPTTLRS